MNETYTLLDGTPVDLTGLTPRQVRLLRTVEEKALDGVPYTDLLTSVFHPLSPLWNGQAPSLEVARGPLMRVLPDLCARVALEQAQYERDFVPVTEYARIKGVSRQTVYAAAARGLIHLEKGAAVSAVVVDAQSRAWQPSPVRQAAGRQRGRPAGADRRPSRTGRPTTAEPHMPSDGREAPPPGH